MDAFTPRASIDQALARQEVVWLSSVRPDGRPHVVPVWFVWDDGSIVVVSKPHAQKVGNLRRDPRVMVAIGEPNGDWDVELIEAEAELAPEAEDDTVPNAFARKYAAQLAHAGTTGKRFAAIYSQQIRIRPTRWLGWGGRGWTDEISVVVPSE